MTDSTEPINDPTVPVVSILRIPDSALLMQTLSLSQGTFLDPELISEDNFVNIQYVQDDFVYRLIQHGTLNFIQ